MLMMHPDEWRRHLIHALGELACLDFQRRVWVDGRGPETSSMSEAVNRLYDDYDLPGYIRDHLRDPSDAETIQVLQSLENLIAGIGQSADDRAIVGSSAWETVRLIAAKAKKMLQDSSRD